MATLNEFLSMRKTQIEQQFENCKKELSYLEDRVLAKQSEMAQYKGAYAEISNLIKLLEESQTQQSSEKQPSETFDDGEVVSD